MYTLTNVTKTYTQSKRKVTALNDVDPRDPGRPAGRHPGPDRRRQVHAAADARRPRPARPPAPSCSRRRASRSCGDGKLTKIRANEIGFVFQGFNLIPTLTAQENVETALAPARR